jgi:simple sugar transport system permease protein
MSDWAILIALLAATVQFSTPILFAALGGVVTERAGIVNLGVEGMMAVGAFCAFLVSFLSGSPWLGLLCGALAACALSMVHGVICLVFLGNQIVSGLALTILGIGLAGFFGAPFIGAGTTGFSTLPIPLLGELPFFGPILFRQDILVYFTFILTPLIWFFLNRTRQGLSLRAVGEYPAAAIAAGISARKIRWAAIGFGGFLAGIGGAYLSLVYTHHWHTGITEGKGWIAVALVIFAMWKPQRAIYGAYLFGGIGALQMRLQALEFSFPSSLMTMLPYLFTVLVLIWAALRGRGRSGPAALGADIEPGG